MAERRGDRPRLLHTGANTAPNEAPGTAPAARTTASAAPPTPTTRKARAQRDRAAAGAARSEARTRAAGRLGLARERTDTLAPDGGGALRTHRLPRGERGVWGGAPRPNNAEGRRPEAKPGSPPWGGARDWRGGGRDRCRRPACAACRPVAPQTLREPPLGGRTGGQDGHEHRERRTRSGRSPARSDRPAGRGP